MYIRIFASAVASFLICTKCRVLFASAEQAHNTSQQQSESLLKMVFSGGPIGIAIMLALIALSVVTAYLIFEQILTIRRTQFIPSGLADNVRQLLHAGQITDAEQLCRKRPCLLSFVLQSGLAECDEGWPAIEKAMEDSLAEQSASLFRKNAYLSVLANIAPMVGLLGTVIGLAISFRQAADNSGDAGTGALATGIYQALVPIVVGLVISIPSFGAFALFRNRIDELLADIGYAAEQTLDPLKHRPPSRSLDPPPPPRPPSACEGM